MMAMANTFPVMKIEGGFSRAIGAVEFEYPDWIARRLDGAPIGRFASRALASAAVRDDGASGDPCDCLRAPAGPDGLCAACRGACEEMVR